MSETEKFGDEQNPKKILQLYDWKTGIEEIFVIDNTALGPGEKCGIPHEYGIELFNSDLNNELHKNNSLVFRED